MKRAVTAVTAIGLVGLVPAASVQGGSEHAPAHIYPTVESQPSQHEASLPEAIRSLGVLTVQASHAPLPSPTTPPTPSHDTAPTPSKPNIPVPPLASNVTVSPERRKQLAKNTAYVKNVLLPTLKRSSKQLIEVAPFNTRHDPVNGPGAFIVKDLHRPDCGSQFVVNVSPRAAVPNHIFVTVFGPVDVLADGNQYGGAAYSDKSGLGHTESDLNAGKDFKQPSQAIAYIKAANAQVCHIETTP